METACLSLDIINTLPQNIIENILSLMPIRDALRTSVLSKKWRYSWRSMPKLIFTDKLVKVPYNESFMKKYKVVNAIFHVFLLHNGPDILEFNCSLGRYHMDSEFAQMISYLAKGNRVKDISFIIEDGYCNLPVSFFSLQGLECIDLQNCRIKLPSTFNGLTRLRRIVFTNVEVSAKMLLRFLSNCPLLDELFLTGYQEGIDFAAGGDTFTFADLFRCVPLIETLDISNYYVKYLSSGGMLHKLPTSSSHLKHLYLDVCLMDYNETSSVLCMIRSSPLLVEINFLMYDKKLPIRQTPTNFLELEHYSDLKLDHLETLDIEMTNSNLPLGMDLVKLIMAKSPMLKEVEVGLRKDVSVDDELMMLRDLVLLPFPRASPSAKLVINRRL